LLLVNFDFGAFQKARKGKKKKKNGRAKVTAA